MKVFIIKIVRYCLIVFVLINVISWASLYFLRNSSFYKPEFLTHEIKDKNFDYIVIGSSIGLTSVDTKCIDSMNTVKGINLSIDDTSTSSSFLMLDHFYHQGGKSKYCILSLSSWDLAETNPRLNNNDYRFLPFVTNDYVHDYYKSMEDGLFKPLTYSYYLPFLGVSYYNTEVFYPSIVAAIQPNKHNRFDDKGNYCYPPTSTFKKFSPKEVILQWKNPFLNKIKALCLAHHTQLIVYQAPVIETRIINTNKSYNFINHSALLKGTKGFYDEVHLDVNGRQVASIALAKELKKDYFIKNGQ